MEIQREVTLPADVDEAWELLTRPDDLAAWLGEATFETRPGAEGELLEPDGTRRRVVVDEVEPGRRLSWSWWTEDDGPDAASRVEVTLLPSDGGTRVTVVERPLAGAASTAQARAATSAAWSHRLLHLEALLLLAAAIRG